MLVASLGWCFLICALAGFFNLSLEMGALIAGVAISTFPYNLDIISKIVNIRDFFITLFFVALGMEIPNPLNNLGMFLVAGAAALFLIASRFLSVYPILYFLKNGNRVSLLTSINLSQLSEFALVITTIGLKSQHIVSGHPNYYHLCLCDHLHFLHLHDQIQPKLQGVLSKVIVRVGFKGLKSPLADELAAPPKTSPCWVFSGSPAPSSGRSRTWRLILKTRSSWWILTREYCEDCRATASRSSTAISATRKRCIMPALAKPRS